MTIKIDKGVPLPTSRSNAKYPWHELEVGDSFFVPDVKSNKVSGSTTAARKKYGFEFITRNVEGGTRVWRVK